MNWLARYNDDTALPQYNADGSENSYANIDRAKLSSFALVDEAQATVYELHLDPGQRLIYRRRVQQTIGADPIVVLMVGWQMTVGGQNVQSIAYVMPDKSIHMAGKWKDDHPWFYSIQAMPFEE